MREALENNEDFVTEAAHHNFTSAQFAKKLMGQIVFLYFLQKKGWLGVSAWPKKLTEKEYKTAFFAHGAKSRELIPKVYQLDDKEKLTYTLNGKAFLNMTDDDETFLATCVKGEAWGTGSRKFMRKLFEFSQIKKKNFFDDFLEPLFYDALNVNRGMQGYDPALHCRIPFLSGGLFEPIDGYDWKYNDFAIPNEIFSNKKDENDREADGILDIFDRYNFTMSEDEPMEREVAIDPEMLGKVFENLLDVKDRKSKGAFYTPREIVHYMCQETLISYLKQTTGLKEQDIRDFILLGDFLKDEDTTKDRRQGSHEMLISEDIFKIDKNGRVVVNRLKDLDNALENIRVADPAVGSGAFPLGMLNEIVRVRQNITAYMAIGMNAYQKRMLYNNDRSVYRLKVTTIKNCIFAADIEPSAVDIAQLRLWLSLVIDDEINPNAVNPDEGHANPLPLPNLECNIICGNSLVDQFEGIPLINQSDMIATGVDQKQQDIFQSTFEAILPSLLKAQNDLFHCDNTHKKQELKDTIASLKDELAKVQLQTSGVPGVLERYYEARRQSSQPFVLWQIDFARVFREKGGFDIVIGNPPYIQLQKTINDETGEKLGDLLADLGYETFAKTGDIYCLFYEKGYNLLRDNGVLSFITSNKWMRAGYGEKLRGFLAKKTNPIRLIDFGSQKIFESATVDVNILLFTKKANEGQTMACTIKDRCLENLSVYVERTSAIMPFRNSNSWTILTVTELAIKNKIDSVGTPLKNWNLSINRGILTGYNEAFIITSEKREELISADPKSAEIIRPILRGKDIKRYCSNFANLWLINVHNGIKGEKIPPINVNDYPAIKKHLNQYYEQLAKRADKGNTPYNLRNCIYMNDFLKQKIVWGNLCLSAQFALADAGYYINAPSPIIVPGNKYILAILNSRLGDWYIRQLGVTRNGGYFEYKPMFVEQLPVPHISEAEQLVFVDMVDQIIALKKQGKDTITVEETLDQKVYQLYGLEKEQIQYINNL